MIIHRYKLGLAAELGVCPKTINQWVKKGLVVKVHCFNSAGRKLSSAAVLDDEGNITEPAKFDKITKSTKGYVYMPHILTAVTERAKKTGRALDKSV